MKIAVVDDDAAVREGAAIVLERPGREIAPFADGQAYLDHEGSFDLTFLDLKMPSLSGFEVLRRLAERGPVPPIVMISAHGDVQAAVQAMRLGARGFVEKPFTPEDLEGAISDLAENEVVSDRTALLEKLTPREREVAVLLDEGLSNKDVARQLDCSPRTIEIHRARIFSKLEVRNVAGLVRRLSGR